jgi:inosose dehydratase
MVHEQTIPLGISAKNWFFAPSFSSEKRWISPEQILSETSLAGFSGIDPVDYIPLNDEALLHALFLRKLKLSGWNISLPIFSQSYQESYHQISKTIQQASHMHASCLNLTISAISTVQRSSLIKFYQFLNQAGHLAAEKRLHLCFRPQIDSPFSSCEQLEDLLFHTDTQNLSICYDIRHIIHANEDVYLTAKNFASRIGSIYLSDIFSEKPSILAADIPYSAKRKDILFTVPGEGCLSFDQIFSNLNLNDYKGWIIIDSYLPTPGLEPFEYALKGIYYLHTLLGYAP